MSALRLEIAMRTPGTTVHLAVFRNGGERAVPVTLGELPSKSQGQTGEAGGPSGMLQGVTVEDLTPRIAGELRLPPGTKGVVVARVGGASRAREAGLRSGDLSQEVNHEPVTNVAEFQRALREAADRPAPLL